MTGKYKRASGSRIGSFSVTRRSSAGEQFADGHARQVLLPFPDLTQEPNPVGVGWCGEATIQMAMAYYGVYVSQKFINRKAKPKHPDIWASETPMAMKNLGLDFTGGEKSNLKNRF
jgi:hypothetical protein